MNVQTYNEIQEASTDGGMGEYHLNMMAALVEYQPVLKELALILKEFGYFHEASESVLTLMLMIDRISDDWMFNA